MSGGTELEKLSALSEVTSSDVSIFQDKERDANEDDEGEKGEVVGSQIKRRKNNVAARCCAACSYVRDAHACDGQSIA